jgi:hypothetical protein
VSERRDRFDPELSELFGEEPDLLELAQLVRESRPEPDLDPRFPGVLRARLMDEARTALAPRVARPPRTARAPQAPPTRRVPRRGFRLRLAPGGLMAWGALGVGAAMVAGALVLLVDRTPAPTLAVVASNVAHQQAFDTHQAITLSFNEPMDQQNQQSVLAALRIQPATQVTVAWNGSETLVITPVHPLAPDTDYQVTIPKAAVESQNGQTLSADVTLQFGTQPAPTVGPTGSPVPALEPAVVGPAANDGLAFWGPDDAPGVTDSIPVSPSSSAVPSATAQAGTAGSPSPSAASSASPSASAAASPSPAPAEGAYIFPPGETPVALSETPAAAAALSPNGFNIALAVAGADGSSEIVVENPDGSGANAVWPTGSAAAATVTALAWDGDNRIVFVTAQGIYAVYVDDEKWTQLYAFQPGGSASGVVLAPDGREAFLPASDMAGEPSPTASASPSTGDTASPTPSISPSPSPLSGSAAASPAPTYPPGPSDGWVVDLGTGAQAASPIQLPGSVSGVVAFSGATDEVAWVDAGDDASIVLEAPTSDLAAITAIPGAPVEGIEELALDAHGATLAYGLDPGGIEVETSGGAVLGTAAEETTSLSFSPDGTQLAFAAAGSLDVAQVQAASQGASTSVCQAADQVLSRFVADQVSHDQAGLASLSAPGAPSAGTVTPAAVDRGYVISSSCTAGTAPAGPTLSASARLIVDPNLGAPGQITDETLLLGQSSGEWQVTGLSVPPLRAQGGGPDVLSIGVTPPASGSVNPESVVTVSFDSDLDPSSVTPTSLWLEDANGQTIPLLTPPTYDPDTRQATLTVSGPLPAGAQVVVGISLADIDGRHPASPSAYPVGG